MLAWVPPHFVYRKFSPEEVAELATYFTVKQVKSIPLSLPSQPGKALP